VCECAREKVNSSFVCWTIARTNTHATCDWDYSWNDGLQIKPTLMPTFVRVTFSKLFTLLNILTWGVGSILPHVMIKLKSDENFVSLIWPSKVSYAMGLGDVLIAKFGQDLHPKRSVKRRSFDLWIIMN
jgi:hypothetical protein